MTCSHECQSLFLLINYRLSAIFLAYLHMNQCIMEDTIFDCRMGLANTINQISRGRISRAGTCGLIESSIGKFNWVARCEPISHYVKITEKVSALFCSVVPKSWCWSWHDWCVYRWIEGRKEVWKKKKETRTIDDGRFFYEICLRRTLFFFSSTATTRLVLITFDKGDRDEEEDEEDWRVRSPDERIFSIGERAKRLIAG